MRHAHTVEQVRAAEQVVLDATPAGTLMATAATGLAVAIADYLGSCYGRRVALLVGAGHNGGDALVAGAWLARRGAVVSAVLLSDQTYAAGLAEFRRAGGRIVTTADLASLRAEVVVDGIVGLGGQPGLRPEAVAALAAVPGVPVIAVDVPSGVGVNDGRIDGPHVSAALTVTFGSLKPCHLLDPAAAACGAIELVDIGIELPPAPLEALQAEDVAARLPVPTAFDHKYTRGVVGLRVGSATYPGAAVLCAAGASTGLAGMVRYAGSAAAEVVARFPAVVAGEAGRGRVQAWVVGSGGAEEAEQALAAVWSEPVPLVVDADALAALAAMPAGLVRERNGLILTPHAGELATLLGVERAAVEANPLRHARQAVEETGAVVLLKGRHTLTVAVDRPVRVTTTGLPWLAVAGAGDVLAGVVGSLLAAGLEPWEAASVGSWIHGAAASIASSGGPIQPDQVAAAVPVVVRSLLTDGAMLAG